jgi:hypothetical protein
MPLAIFGAEGYASLMVRLAMPSLVAGATAPFVGAMVLENFGQDITFAVLACAAVVNLVIVWPIWLAMRPKTP